MLRDLRASDVALVGAKAANLGELVSAGFPVPDGLCVPVSVYESTVGALLTQGLDLLAAQIADGASDDQLESFARPLRDAIEAVALPAELLAGIARAYGSLCPPGGGAVVVRSSGTLEDSAAASFAGQYHTERGIRSLDEVVSAMKLCWASLWQVHAIRYRERRAIQLSEVGMAVIVQVMLVPDAAGVMFTVEPGASTSDAADRIVIESARGHGEAIAGGLVNPDRIRVSRDDLRIVVAERQAAVSLTHAQASTLAGLGLAIEAHFGCTQDVEWAIAAGKIAILQARPITGLSTRRTETVWASPIEGARWGRISICDSLLPEPLTPLFATTLFPCLIEGWRRAWAGPEAERRANPLLPSPASCTINGFAYLRLDYPLNRHPLRTARLILNFLRFYFGRLERKWRTVTLSRHIERLEALRACDLASLAACEIVDLIGEAQDLSGVYWGVVGGLAWRWNFGEWFLGRVYRRLARRIAQDGATPLDHSMLLQGYPTRTIEAEFALYDLARSDVDEDELARRFDAFLAAYGHQVYNLDFVEPTSGEDPSSFRAMIKAYRDGRAADPHQRLGSLAERRDLLQARIARSLRWSPLSRWILEATLTWNRHYGQVRDQVHFCFTLGWPVIRCAYLELGRRLAAAGGLGSPDDVFFLTGDELAVELQAIELGRAPTIWTERVRKRRATREAQRRLSPPDQVPPHAPVFLGSVDITSIAFIGRFGRTEEEASLRGSAVSPGRVTAPARRICAIQDFAKLQAGDVLVAPYITPAWSSLLAIAGGVVTDVGGTLSHGSIVAREYGIPTVMGTNDATRLIEDGQIITIDGDRGLVYL